MAGIPNFLSSLRLGFVPVLLMLAFTGEAQIFLVCLAISLLTDVLDGFLARLMKATSAFGAKLDSLADLATCLAMAPCAWWLKPDVLRAEAISIIVVLAFYFLAHGASLIKFRRLPSYHTWLAKVAGTLAAVEFLVIFAGGPAWTLRLLVPIVVLACLEEFAITLTLREWRPDVPSLWHARQITKTDDDVKPVTGAR